MITIYTDGSCLTNPGNGGWAAIINENNEKKIISGNKKNTPDRIELKKYNPILRKYTVHKEIK